MYFEGIYLKYLNDEPLTEQEGGLISQLAKSTKGGFKGQLKFAGAITSAIIAFKALQFAFSKARRRCGSIFASEEQVPARKICVDKEKIKLYNKQLAILNSKKSECSKEKDPDECNTKFEMKINNVRINLQIAKEDLEQHMSELKEQFDVSLSELKIPTASKAIVTGFEWFILGTLVDKTLFYAWRSAQGLFSSASRRCGTFAKGNERELCMSRIRLQALSKKLGVLTQVIAKCAKEKDPKKCTEKFTNEIDKVRSRMEMERNNIAILTKQIRIEKMKKALERRR